MTSAIEAYWKNVDDMPLWPSSTREELRQELATIDLSNPLPESKAIDFVVRGLTRHQLHTASPSYFGVFNPRALPLGVAGDLLASAFNPQLASWTSSPFGIEIEQRLLSEFGAKFGYTKTEGTFTGGGTEANHTALLVSLAQRFPEFMKQGARALPQPVTVYVSEEAHHSFHKAARLSGLGEEAIREIPVDAQLRMDPALLKARIHEDRDRGMTPLFVVATAGTTSAGMVDDLRAIAAVASDERLWYHVDAAWGGAAVLVPELAESLSGIGLADSITLDAHKWLSVPMTAGMFLSRHSGVLRAAFRVGETAYMPNNSQGESEKHQPYAESMAWSRRALGLKLFLPLAVLGWKGYEDLLHHQTVMGQKLKSLLVSHGWKVVNETPLPVACFVDPSRGGETFVEGIAEEVAKSGKSWVTTTKLARHGWVLRAGISNYLTEERHLTSLMETLQGARSRWGERSHR